MSKVPYTINVDEFICSELELIRTMDKTRDYSGLMAAVERIQFYASSMENALSSYGNIRYVLKHDVFDKEISDEEFRKSAKKAFAKVKPYIVEDDD